MTRALRILAKKEKPEQLKDQKKETANTVSTKDSNDALKSSISYAQFKNAIGLLKSLDAQDRHYPEWIALLEELLSDLKSRVQPHSTVALTIP
jgi:hypothetical protein